MRHAIAMIVGFIVFLICILLEVAHYFGLIRELIPESVANVINNTSIFVLMSVGLLVFLLAYFDHRLEVRKHSSVAVNRAGLRMADVDFHPKIKLREAGPNVQCLGIEAGNGTAKICFQNVAIPGEQIGYFREARVKVDYSLEAYSEQVATIFPARWIGFDEGEIEVGVTPQCAVLAVYLGTSWIAVDISNNRFQYTPLPSTRLKIVATLFGENNLSLPPIAGLLILGEDGIASFIPQ